MLIQMTKSSYLKAYAFEGKISQGILENHTFLPEPVELSWLDGVNLESRIGMECEE